jgi:hypothetical protein
LDSIKAYAFSPTLFFPLSVDFSLTIKIVSKYAVAANLLKVLTTAMKHYLSAKVVENY